ncbi:MAG TPA: HdeD family acid-resistance protein [Trinickia sp.]|jgi:uncharacterized membrane protein HdeD (DUF308 family)|uniref:HdeD family acid-resistance protein n=1 Tax=Trinickia sp. TaxID=2571163 RepID=UPI002C5CB23B|nr:HdeD family acid-resistance protein [Trinickia sp.]HTI16477.1 HdeD family acid-resistance protein [Trinickia sp.]
MDQLLRGAWWMLVLRGVVAVLFGVFALVWPGLTLFLLIGMFAAYAIVGGVASIVAAIQQRAHRTDWWVPLLFGLSSVAAGVIMLFVPGLGALVLISIMGATALVTGVFDVIAAMRLKSRGRSAWMMFLIGAVSVIFGGLVLLYPWAGALALVWMVSVYAIISGVFLIALGIRAHNWRQEPIGAQPRTAT